MSSENKQGPDVKAGRLQPKDYETVFCDLAPPLTVAQAQVEASRCYYCYDAPCVRSCPTEIDIPSFIRKIGNGNLKGAALDILSANIMGGTCARVCPVETLCEKACVRNEGESIPVKIGRLQRYATDEFFRSQEQPFQRAPSTGKSVAVVGAGPAGLSCAHRLATLGYEVTIFESRKKPGGLNEYGLAPYKVADNFAQREVEFILGIGGITMKYGQALGRDFSIDDLKAKFSAVFLGLGLGGNNRLDIPGEDLQGVTNATQMIEMIRQCKDLSALPVGRQVVVIGGGNTAIDIAIQMKRLGAEFVTVTYRRGEEQMGATGHERELAQRSGVLIKTGVRPVKIIGGKDGVSGVEFEYTIKQSGKWQGTGKSLTLRADQVFKAIGQTLNLEGLKGSRPEIARGKFTVNENLETTVEKVFSGGDCIDSGEDLTVTAVQQGKLAALAIHKRLGGKNHG